MSLSNNLFWHSVELLDVRDKQLHDEQHDICLRRAVSAAYYAIFHHLSQAAVEQLGPHTSLKFANSIHRHISHSNLKKACQTLTNSASKQTFVELLGAPVSDDMQTVALNVIKLQEARHLADYDPDYQLSWMQAKEHVKLAGIAMLAWNKFCPSAESRTFLLMVVLGDGLRKRT